MNFFNDPQYSSIRIILIVLVIAGVGFFAYKSFTTSNDQASRVIDPNSQKVATDNNLPKSNIPMATIAPDPDYTTAGSQGINGDKKTWHQIGEALNGAITGIYEYDSGTSVRLYVGGFFTGTESGSISSDSVARYRESSKTWEALPNPNTGNTPNIFQAYQGNLFAGAQYQDYLVKLPLSPLGSSWTNVPLDGTVMGLHVFNNKLYGGDILSVGNTNVLTNGIAAWDNINWTNAGTSGSFHPKSDFVEFNGNLITISSNLDSNDGVWEFDGTSWTKWNNSSIHNTYGAGIAGGIVVFQNNLYALTKSDNDNTVGVHNYLLNKWNVASSKWETLLTIPMKTVDSSDMRHYMASDDKNLYITNVSSDGIPVVVKWNGTGTTLNLVGKELQGQAASTGSLFTDIYAPNKDHLYVSGYFTKSNNENVKYLADFAKTGI